NSGGERRATSAIWTPFQPDTAMPAKAARTTKLHNGQADVLKPSRMVEAAEPRELIAKVVVLDATWSAIHPSVTRPSMLVVCITAKTRPAVLSDWPSATTKYVTTTVTQGTCGIAS